MPQAPQRSRASTGAQAIGRAVAQDGPRSRRQTRFRCLAGARARTCATPPACPCSRDGECPRSVAGSMGALGAFISCLRISLYRGVVVGGSQYSQRSQVGHRQGRSTPPKRATLAHRGCLARSQLAIMECGTKCSTCSTSIILHQWLLFGTIERRFHAQT
jgi:hypothetical protein